MSEMLRTGKSAVVIAMVVLAYCAFAEGQTAAAIVTVVVGAGALLALQKLTKHCVQSEQPKQGFWRRILYTVIDNRSVVYMILMATMISSYRDWMSAAFNLALRLLPMVLIELGYARWREDQDLKKQQEHPTTAFGRVKRVFGLKTQEAPAEPPQPAVVPRAPRKKLKGYPYKDKEEAPSN